MELDDPVQAAPFRADPSAALAAAMRRAHAGSGTLLLDEWQVVPETLGAVKRAVDRGLPPGAILLTGSVRAPLTSASWPGTGRVITIEMHPMAVLEQHATAAPHSDFVSRLFAGEAEQVTLPPEPPDFSGYVDLIAAGGYPAVLGAAAEARALWLESYAEQLVQRDVPKLGEIRDPAALRRLLRAFAECTGTLRPDTELAATADINVKTVRRHERLLEDLRIVTSLPAWHTNRLSRLVKQRKHCLIDTGLAMALLDADTDTLYRRGDLLSRMLETFVLAQLRPLLQFSTMRVCAHHLRQHDGRREIDVLLEAADGRVAALKVKASSAPTVRDARDLQWLRDELGERFVCGAVLHTGPQAFRLAERITALPIAALWSEPSD